MRKPKSPGIKGPAVATAASGRSGAGARQAVRPRAGVAGSHRSVEGRRLEAQDHGWRDREEKNSEVSASRQKGATRFDTPVRVAARAEARRLYPEGKALARIRYFEAQRGLAPVVMPVRHVASANGRNAQGAERITRLPHANPHNLTSEPVRRFNAGVGLPVWRELGPTLIPHGATYGKGRGAKPAVSGRCSGIDVDPANPSHLTLCSAGGGLWGSEDGGANWRPLTDQQPALAMGGIARSVSPPSIVYAPTGDGDGQITYGGGLLRSTDSGRTWSYVASRALAGEGIYDIAVDPSDGLHVWIGGTFGLYETTDAGQTVCQVRSTTTWDISVDPSNPRDVFIGCEAGLRRSANGGRSWHRVHLPGVGSAAKFDRVEVCHAPSNPAIVYVAASVAGEAMLWRRATAAGALKRLNVPARMDTSQAWYDWCFAVAPDDADVVVWGAIELYRGRCFAGRMAWRNISSRKHGASIHPDQHDVAFDPSDAKTLYVCNDGGVFRSRDLGAHWDSLNPGLGITEFEFLAHLESDADWLIGGTQDNGTIADAGTKHWKQIAVGDGGDCGPRTVGILRASTPTTACGSNVPPPRGRRPSGGETRRRPNAGSIRRSSIRRWTFAGSSSARRATPCSFPPIRDGRDPGPRSGSYGPKRRNPTTLRR
jgi:photosystem II stability/assembly factor-like uncharacterized protein